MRLPVFALDGEQFRDLDSFARYFSEVVLRGAEWHGNLDALNDILRGGFGTPEGGFVLRIVNVDAARTALGYRETAQWFEQHALTCHPTNRSRMLARAEEARAGIGDTLFEMIVEIIRGHGPGGDEVEDNVLLELAPESPHLTRNA